MSDTYVPRQQGGVPAVPNVVAGSDGPPITPASPDPRPLITAADYARITGDAASDSTAVDEALADALLDTAKLCNRTWGYGQYTELLYLYKNGMVFPSATPIDVNQPVIAGEQVYDPSGQDSASVVQGAGIWVGWFTPLPWMPVWTGVIPPQTEVTYWGGYAEPTVPPKLKRIWARVAWYYLHPVTLPGLPGGSKSASAAGIQVSGDLSIITASDPQLKRDLRRWTRRQAHAWQA